jgi:hypothetical protein
MIINPGPTQPPHKVKQLQEVYSEYFADTEDNRKSVVCFRSAFLTKRFSVCFRSAFLTKRFSVCFRSAFLTKRFTAKLRFTFAVFLYFQK